MNNNETCKHGANSPIELLASLQYSQAGSGRHRCPTCAYESGFNIATSKNWDSFSSYIETVLTKATCSHGSVAPTDILLSLGVNQGGTGRHKCTNCAFSQGFQDGLFGTSSIPISLELVSAPQIKKNAKTSDRSNTRLLDFIKIENENKKLGYLGELFILQNEINLLKSQEKFELANRVKHVSVEIGDGLGYDILSFDANGAEKKIEVKTTRAGINRLFYLTRNEINISEKYAETYYLYRLFDFNPTNNKGKYYIIEGSLESKLDLDSLLYSATPKSI